MEEEIRLIIQNLGISIGANLLYDIGKKREIVNCCGLKFESA